jgi:hypothetical protein
MAARQTTYWITKKPARVVPFLYTSVIVLCTFYCLSSRAMGRATRTLSWAPFSPSPACRSQTWVKLPASQPSRYRTPLLSYSNAARCRPLSCQAWILLKIFCFSCRSGTWSCSWWQGRTQGDAQDARASPPPPCASPPHYIIYIRKHKLQHFSSVCCSLVFT